MNRPLAHKPWLKCYEEAVPGTIEVPDHPLHHYLEQSARNYPENTSLLFKGHRISYRELNRLAGQLAAALATHGFKKGDRAAIYMPNTPQFVIAYYGILKAGGVVVATNPLYTERELTDQLADCGAETVFVLSLFYDRLKNVQKSGRTAVRRVIVANIKEYLPAHLRLLFTLVKEKKEGHRATLEAGDLAFQDFLQAGKIAPRPGITVTGEDVALLQYTGGTTGIAKGAIGLHRNLVANTVMIQSWLTDTATSEEIILTAIPLFHSYGMIAAMSFAMSIAGAMVLIPNPRDLKDLLSSLNKYRPTIFPGVPAMYAAINNDPDVVAGKYDLRSIRACISGSAPLLLQTKERFEELTGGKLVEGYGLTEAHVATHANPIYGLNKAGSIGLPLPSVECRVVDVDNPEIERGIGEPGELLLKGPSIMPGYWNMADETANVFRDGWLHTGDVVECDEDGYFFIRDRKKDMIIVGGFNVYPREVEEVLSRHPAVMEAAVAGIPDPQRDETVKAWIVRQPGNATTEAEIIAWTRTELARYKCPRLIEFRDELPRSATLKILKRELVREHLARTGDQAG